MFKIQLARQGQTMEQATIVRWVKQEGDDLAIGEELYEIESEKAIVSIEATRPGRLVRIVAAPGEIVPVGAVLAIAADHGESITAAEVDAMLGADGGAANNARSPLAPPAPIASDTPRPASTAKLPVMPKARALARELGVDLAKVRGTGANGMILPEDVRSAASERSRVAAAPFAAGAAAATGARVSRKMPLSPIGRTMVVSLERAWQVPQFTQGILIDASALVRGKEAAGDRLSYMDFFLDAIVRAARAVPDVLARLVDRDVLFFDAIDVSIATATEHGLLLPVLRDSGALSVAQRAPAWRALIDGARSGRLVPEQMSGGMIALSNLGTRGVDYGTPLLPLGHSAIVFVGGLANRPLVVGDQLEARPSLSVSVTYDHRVVDGVLGSRFTSALREALLAPGA